MLKLDPTPRPWQQVAADFANYRYKLYDLRRGKNRYSVCDICAAFDIETTSMHADIIDAKTGKKSKKATGGVMWIWQFAIDGCVYIGRTWPEYVAFCELLSKTFGLGAKKRLLVYVHNIGFEFQFLRRWFRFDKIFAVDNRVPVTATTDGGIEYRCSYKLTNASLQYVADNMLHQYTIKKLKGELDYDKKRGPWTDVTKHEMAYCVNDVLILNAYIDEQRQQCGKITSIPLTSTGYVREDVRNHCFRDQGGGVYQKWLQGLTITPTVYKQLSLVKAGGYTHSSVWHTGQVITDVGSYDITSSYPAVMVAEKFPMSKFFNRPPAGMKLPKCEADFDNYKDYCWYCRVALKNVESKVNSDFYLSQSKCVIDGKKGISNGRIIYADEVTTWVTNVDFDIIKDFYDFDLACIAYFRWAHARYLPKPIVEKVLEYYVGKTQLKNVDGSEQEYARKKANTNSIFGMMLTDPVTGEIDYYDAAEDADEWIGWVDNTPEPLKDPGAYDAYIDEKISKHNKSKTRFLYYPWGVWITAYARRNITRAIIHCGGDYLYCDTDSTKIKNWQMHKDWYDAYNAEVTDKMNKALDYHGLPRALAAPLDKDGVPHPIGWFDFEGTYTRFKTLGAKRYIVEHGPGKKQGKIETTVAGCGKTQLADYLQTLGDPFDFFDEALQVPAGHTGKLIHTYGDYDISGKLTDYNGVIGEFYEKSWVSLGPCEYNMNISDEFLWWIANTDKMGSSRIPVH